MTNTLHLSVHPQTYCTEAPQSVREVFDRAGATLSNARHLVIDIQKKYLQDTPLEALGEKIALDIAPAFNRLSIPTYWVYWSDQAEQIPSDLTALAQMGGREAHGELYSAIDPAREDRILPKANFSGFRHAVDADQFDKVDDNAPTVLHQAIKRDNVKVLFVSGVFQSACVEATIRDALLKGCHVVALADAMDNHSFDRFYFEKRMGTSTALRWDTSLEKAACERRDQVFDTWRRRGVMVADTASVLAELKAA
jgi:nicotinamidase-related amidase